MLKVIKKYKSGKICVQQRLEFIPAFRPLFITRNQQPAFPCPLSAAFFRPKPGARSLKPLSRLKPAFTLTEVLIVIAILGILAAVILPEFANASQKAKEAAAKENLQILRSAIQRYAIEHQDIAPGYANGTSTGSVLGVYLYRQTVQENHYISTIPSNPFNGENIVLEIPNNQPFPQNATGQYGWIYQPATKTIRLDWPGTDSAGIAYYDY